MANIAFWTLIHGQTANTTNVIASSLLASMDYSLKTLVTHTQWSHSTLESSLLKESIFKNDIATFSDVGMDALERLARANRLSPESIKDYTSPIIKEKLDLLIGTSKRDQDIYEKLNDVIKTILTAATRYYELLFIDVHAGSRNQITNTVLNQSDLIVVCLNQNPNVLERFLTKEDWPEALHNKPYVIVLGQYDTKSKYTIKNIKRKYKDKIDVPIYAIPYCTEFKDALNDKEVRQFFIKNKNVHRGDENYLFMQELRKFIKDMLVKVGVETELRQSQRGAS